MDDVRPAEPRPAEPGELCTCGRQARLAIPTHEYGDVGWCGQDGGALQPALPCPWCAATKAHTTPWGDPVRCPNYTLRPKDESLEDEGGQT